MGIFVLRNGLRFSFRALEVAKPRVRKRSFSLPPSSPPPSPRGRASIPGQDVSESGGGEQVCFQYMYLYIYIYLSLYIYWEQRAGNWCTWLFTGFEFFSFLDFTFCFPRDLFCKNQYGSLWQRPLFVPFFPLRFLLKPILHSKGPLFHTNALTAKPPPLKVINKTNLITTAKDHFDF